MEYLLIAIVLITGYIFISEKLEQKKKMPFTDTLSKIN